LKYVVKGLDKAQKFASEQKQDDPNIENVMDYIEKIELFKHCEEETSAAILLQKLGLSLEHVPAHLLKSRKVNY